MIDPRSYELKDGRILLIRLVAVEDAGALIDYAHAVSAESNFLTFGPGEFNRTLQGEEEFINQRLAADNHLFILGTVDDVVVALLNFTGGSRPRLRHSGGFGLSVRKNYWGLGIGSLMLDTLIEWARRTGIVKKINLQVRADNHRAIQLYKSKGFVREGTLHKEIYLNGKYFDNYWMGLQI